MSVADLRPAAEPGNIPTADELIARARALAPKLRERAVRAERDRNIPQEFVDEYLAAGLIHILQPKRWGGYEHDHEVAFNIALELGKSTCGSSAWCLNYLSDHACILAHFPEEAQHDVWSRDKAACIATSAAPTGKVSLAPGGFILDGRWSWCSGLRHSQWIMIGGLVFREGEDHPDMRLYLVPVSQVKQEAQRAGRQAIPIVFVAVSDPVGAGFVTSLARPSGNLTGLMNFEASITGKWLAMLKEIAPTLGRVGLVGNPRETDFDYFLRAMRAVAPSLALEPVQIDVETGTDIEREIELFARKPGGSLVLPPDATTISHSDLVIALADRHRLPAIYPFRFFVAAGGLMSYATDWPTSIGSRLATSTESCGEPSRPIFPYRRRQIRNCDQPRGGKSNRIGRTGELLMRADEVIE